MEMEQSDPFIKIWEELMRLNNDSQISSISKHRTVSNVYLRPLTTDFNYYNITISSLAFISILMNLMVVISCIVLIRKGQQPKCTYLLLGNLSLADMLDGFSVIVCYMNPYYNKSHFSCLLEICAIIICAGSSVYTIAFIAIDRYVYIIHGLKYYTFINMKRTFICIIFSWILGIFMALLMIFGWNDDTDNGKFCWYIVVAPDEHILITIILGTIPLPFICILYSIILNKAIETIVNIRSLNNSKKAISNEPTKLRAFRGSNSSLSPSIDSSISNISQTVSINEKTLNGIIKKDDDVFPRRVQKEHSINYQPNIHYSSTIRRRHMRKWKAIVVVLLTSGAFAITMGPFYVGYIYYVFKCDRNNKTDYCEYMEYIISSPLAILAFINTLLNPLIYAWWHNGFRTSIKGIFMKRRERSKIFKSLENNRNRNKSKNIQDNTNKTTVLNS